MGPNLKKLISIAGEEVCKELPQLSQSLLAAAGNSGRGLTEMLYRKNGFRAFESALHVLPSGCRSSCIELESWNRDDSWRKGYGAAASGYLFFAEDAFGAQFAIGENGVYKFDPETAETEEMASDIDEWAARILDDYEYETGYQLAHEWQQRHGELPPGKRLLPKIPFVLGGEYELENLYAADALRGMEFRADLWNQIRELPDGAEIKLRIIK